MFQPASMKGDSPTPTDERIRNKYLICYILIIIVSFFPCSIYEYLYVSLFWRMELLSLFFLLLPLNFFGLIYLLQFSAILFSYLTLRVVNLIHLPKEGYFKRDILDKDYLYWNIRNLLKKWPLYVTATNPFPWCKNRFTLRFFGVKIGRNTICDNSWISSEFVNIGKNVIIGMNSTIITFGIEQDNFIIKKIIIEDNVLIGAKCVLLPGTLIKKNAKLSAHSYTNYDDILEGNLIYTGHPAKIKKKEENDY